MSVLFASSANHVHEAFWSEVPADATATLFHLLVRLETHPISPMLPLPLRETWGDRCQSETAPSKDSRARKIRAHNAGGIRLLPEKAPRKKRADFHGRFLRSENFLLQKHATLRNALRMLNSRSPSIRESMQSSETMCNSLGLNP
jgi:hypothetical protein